jgi:hypothetical protein
MRGVRRTVLSLGAAVSVLCVLPATSIAAGVLHAALVGPSYVIVTSPWAQVNDANQVAGASGPTGAAARWQNGTITSYTLGPDGAAAAAFAIDGAGTLFGTVVPNNGPRLLAVWPSPGTLDTIPNPNYSRPVWQSVSDSGIAASGNVGIGGLNNTTFEAAIGRPPSYTPQALPITLGSCGTGVSVNDSAEVAGTDLCGGAKPFPFLYENGSIVASKVWINDGYELNDNGDVAGQLGQTGTASLQAGIEFANGTLETLPPLYAGDSVTVKALNDSDMAVGWDDNQTAGASAGPSDGYTAVAWVDGKPIPVSSLVAGGFDGTLTAALDVNNDGSILADGIPAGSTTPETYLLGAPAPLRVIGNAVEGEDGTHVTGGAADGVLVHVTGVTDEEQVIDQSTATNAGGSYQFKLAPGEYALKLEKGVCIQNIKGCVESEKFTITDADKTIDLVAQSGKLAVSLKPKSSTIKLSAGHPLTIKVAVDVSNKGPTTIPDAVAQSALLTSWAGEATLSSGGIPLRVPLSTDGGPHPASVGPLAPHQTKVVVYTVKVSGAGSFLLEALVIGHTSRGQRLVGVGSAPVTVVVK